MADISKHDQHPSSPRSRDLASTALEFLSNASNETLCACTVGLGIATYLVLGRIGLLLIGVGAGVVLHATWADEKGRGSYGSSGEESTRRREVGLDIVKRLLDWQDGKSSELVDASEEGDVVSTASSRKELNFSEFRPETRSALTTLVDAVIRDYVKYVVFEVYALQNSDSS